VQFAILLAASLATRASVLGDPNYQIDEGFYLFVGQALHNGARLYVDIWDRKPPLLFALYWLFAAFPHPVIVYQLAAALCAAATAWTIARIAHRLHGPRAALPAGLVYLAALAPLLGLGGQSPVFYNLAIASAAAMLARDWMGDAAPRPGRAALAALLCGIAVAIKPTALFESAFIVLGFGALAWRRAGRGDGVRMVAAGVGLGAVPVLAGYAVMLVQGTFAEGWQATVLSNFARQGEGSAVSLAVLHDLLWRAGPLMIAAMAGLAMTVRERRVLTFEAGWLIAALAGFLAVPGFYLHYALPLAVPLCVLAGRLFAERLGVLLAAGLALQALVVAQAYDLGRGRSSKAQFDAVAQVIAANLHGGPLYVHSGPPALYRAACASWTSRYVFPEHLATAGEASALGADPSSELDKVLAARPAVIVVRPGLPRTLNPRTWSLLSRVLARDYRPLATMPLTDIAGPYRVMLFVRQQPATYGAPAPHKRSCRT
jgi:hypothetical protein